MTHTEGALTPIAPQIDPPLHWLWHACAAMACAAALVAALRTVEGLQWPPDEDNFRDVSAAQAALDGAPLSDPFYAGEWLWYNPLVPWLVALGSAVTGASPEIVSVQGGPWLNVLVPVAFYVLAAHVAGRGAAFLALVLFLFWNGGNDGMVSATYVPWLWVGNFAQAPFYFTLLAIFRSAERPSLMRGLAAGVLGGLTFLAHAGPAIVAAIVAAALMNPRVLAAAGAGALVVAGPFLYALVGQYGLRVLNDAPMAWQHPLFTADGLPDLLLTNGVIVGAGLAGAVALRRHDVRVWAVVSAICLVYALVRPVIPGLPALVPAFHFWRCLMGALTLLAGAVLWQALTRLGERRAVLLAVAGCFLAVAVGWQTYRERFDFVTIRAIALKRDVREQPLAAELRRMSRVRDVVLASEFTSLQVVGPSGRKSVAVGAIWSNPYVDHTAREQDAAAMMKALKAGDQDQFRRLAARYGVTRVVSIDPNECRELSAAPLMVITSGQYGCVLAVAPPP